MERICKKHGMTAYASRSDGGGRCKKCRSEAVDKRRKKVKSILVEEAGGCCILCGYSKCVGALHFHHLYDKSFGLAAKGATYSIERMRSEVAKCVLLCANCHSEVENGVTTI